SEKIGISSNTLGSQGIGHHLQRALCPDCPEAGKDHLSCTEARGGECASTIGKLRGVICCATLGSVPIAVLHAMRRSPTRRWGMLRNATIDKSFQQAVPSGTMPGIVAMAATDQGPVYEGAFGTRQMGARVPMTLDTVVWIASMTKAVTATAAMQLVERGRLSLDGPGPDGGPELAKARVLEGFDASGRPKLRTPRQPITLRQLLTHTAGFAYEIWRTEIAQYQEATGTPGITTCTNAALTTPLLFDPGDKWEYGINIDWAGKMVEAASGQKLDRYFQENVFSPLGMQDTSFYLS